MHLIPSSLFSLTLSPPSGSGWGIKLRSTGWGEGGYGVEKGFSASSIKLYYCGRLTDRVLSLNLLSIRGGLPGSWGSGLASGAFLKTHNIFLSLVPHLTLTALCRAARSHPWGCKTFIIANRLYIFGSILLLLAAAGSRKIKRNPKWRNDEKASSQQME